ncbi:MAG: hypothetical protein VYC51_10510, partial [Pseudomonadota bacterium]|nr:hypothetical protein [Pseudomonadota bacterium]
KFGFCWLAGLVEIYWPLNLKFYTLSSVSRRFLPFIGGLSAAILGWGWPLSSTLSLYSSLA